MSEMEPSQNQAPSPIEPGEASLQNQFEAYVAERRGWVSNAADILAGKTGANVEETLPLPMEQQQGVRRDSATPELDPEGEQRLREIAGRFGIGGEQDVTLEAAGLPGGHVAVLEGGLVWKMTAESKISNGHASEYVYAGSPYRNTTDAEHAFEVARLEINADNTSTTEYDAARLVAESAAGYVPLEEEIVLPFGYDIHSGFSVTSESTGQLVQIGTRDGKPVLLLRVDRENYIDEEDNNKPKYRKQPDTAAIMGIMSDVLTAKGDVQTAVGIITSNTYASRALDTMRAGYTRGRQFGVAMYGRQTLADTKGETVSEPTELFQIPGELRVMWEKLQLLADTVEQAQEV